MLSHELSWTSVNSYRVTMGHLVTLLLHSFLPLTILSHFHHPRPSQKLPRAICFPTISPTRGEERQVSMTTISALRLETDPNAPHLQKNRNLLFFLLEDNYDVRKKSSQRPVSTKPAMVELRRRLKRHFAVTKCMYNTHKSYSGRAAFGPLLS